MTDRLNVTVKTVEEPHMNSDQLENGSFTGLLGLLQRKEVDVVSVGRGVSLERSNFFDYPMATDWQPITLIAKKPTKIAPSTWVFVRVFGVTQWSIFLSLLVAIVIQGSRIRFVLGCVIPRAGAVARSRNQGQALFGSPVTVLYRLCLCSKCL